MTMGPCGVVRFYLKGFYETILTYASVKLLPVGQRNSASFNIHSSVSNLTFFVVKRRGLLRLSFNFLQENLLMQGELRRKKQNQCLLCSSNFC